MSIQRIVNQIVREHGVVDNGLSDKIAHVCHQMTFDVVREEINFAVIASECLHGELQRAPRDRSPSQIADDAMHQAEVLHGKLMERAAYLMATAKELQ